MYRDMDQSLQSMLIVGGANLAWIRELVGSEGPPDYLASKDGLEAERVM